MTDRYARISTGTSLPDEPQSNHDLEAGVIVSQAEREEGQAESRHVHHALKVEEFWYAFGPSRPIYSQIRLKGRWLAKIFPPNSRVVIEEGEGLVTIRKER
jgi:hypothetical protein